MHKTEKQNVNNGFDINITSNVEVGEARCGDPRGLL